MWLPAFACTCGALIFVSNAPELVCLRCGTRIARVDGVFRCLPPERQERLTPFLAQYRRVRQQDGYRTDQPGYYRALPETEPDDPQASVWAIRRRSFQRLCREVVGRRAGASPAVLELGAGCGWLSHRLTRLGCRAVAVDLLDDDCDGLGAGRHYERGFPRVQADFDLLPFAPGQFDLVVFNGSLHYAPVVAASLDRACRMLRAGGRLAIVDSPTFERRAEGLQMRNRLRQRLCRDYGVPAPVEPGEGFLTFGRLAEWAAASGRSARFFSSLGGWRWQLRRFVPGRLVGRPAAAEFGVWIAA